MNRMAARCLGMTASTLVVATASLVGAGGASAHVSANAPSLTQGGYGVVTLVVPNESDTAATTALTVTLPALKSARPEAMTGWKSVVVKNPSTDEATAVTWTALPGAPGVPVGEFAQFRISGGPFPNQENVSLPTVQTYADGEKVDWSQPMGSDGTEPEHPVPTLTLPAGSGESDHHGAAASTTTSEASATQDDSSSNDSAARWLGGIGLLIGAVGAVVSIAALTRSRGDRHDGA
ncbi:DUF1775 domain-containing protein [Gordonia sp. NPDC003424]